MSRFRFTIASLLGTVGFLAVAIAALREATEVWASGLFELTLLTLLTAVLLAVHRSERKRAFWLGYALFGWAYLVASLIPPVESRLLTTKAMAYVDSIIPRTTALGLALSFDSDGLIHLIVADGSSRNVIFRDHGDGTFQDVSVGSTAAVKGGTLQDNVIIANASTKWKTLIGSRATSADFIRIGHALLAVVMALVGGWLSRWMYAKSHASSLSAPDGAPVEPSSTA